MQKTDDQSLFMMINSSRHYYLFGLLCLMIYFATGCENTFDPFNEDEGYYSIFGDLDLHADTNFVRVRDLNTPLNEDTTAQIDATVTLTNLDTGTSEVLTDSLITFEGVSTHNFYTGTEIKEANEYKIQVDGPDGKSVSMNAVTPYDSDITIDTGNVEDGCDAQITITLDPFMQISTLFVDVIFIAPGEFAPETKYRYEPDINFTDISEEGVGTQIMRFTPREAILAQTYLRQNLSTLLENYEDKNPCYVLLDDVYTFELVHYGSGYYKTISDSIKIPGGEGRFISKYDTTRNFLVPAVTPYVDE